MSGECSDARLFRHRGTTLHCVEKQRAADAPPLMALVDGQACQQQDRDVTAGLAPQQARSRLVGVDGAGCYRVVAQHPIAAVGGHIDASGAVPLGLTRVALKPGIERLLAAPEAVERMAPAKRPGMR